MAVRLVTRRQRRSCRVLSLSLLLAAALLVWVGIRLPHDVKAAAFGRSKAARRSRVRSTRTVPYKFFDAGGTVYHDINFTCPVPWVSSTAMLPAACFIWCSPGGGPPICKCSLLP